MAASKLILEALKSKDIPFQTIHSRKNALRKKVSNAISSEVAIDIVASKVGIDVHKLLTKDDRLEELKDFKHAKATYNFDNESPKRERTNNKEISKEKDEKSPYDYPLSKFNIDAELITDCKIQKPYRNAVKEAMLTLETKIQSSLGLDSTIHGVDLIKEAQTKGIFDRKDKGESEGLNLLYRGSIQWLRNTAAHRKLTYTKEDALKIVLFSDYLIRLFDDLVNKRI